MYTLLSLSKRKFFLVLCLLFTSVNIYSQNWLKGEGGVTNDEALDVASDSSGNYYVTGYFTSAAIIGTTTLNSSGNSDIFIAKYNAAGAVLWAAKAGGPGADRAYSIKADDAGNVYITGYYYGTANFGSSSITSVAGTQDVFIAKYDTAGTVQWVKSIGGTDSETGYGITCDHAGNVIVTGQFKGTATFGSTSLTSAIDPITNLRSFDIFTVKYNGSGSFLWVEHGLAKYDDRGLDVAVDLSDNIYVVGQFSDTIEFDVTHNNQVMNSGYLMKYDAGGNEQWFIKMSASQTIVYSIAVDLSNNILITGDFKGTLGIFTNPIVYSTSNFSNKIFIAKFSTSGSALWVENDGSDSDITSKSIAIDHHGDAYISGLFKCRFDEYSQTIGTGIFYSSGYRDVFVTKYSAAGARQWIRHFGSNKDDYCSGIAVNTSDKPVIAGSFENRFNIPYTSAFTVSPENINSGSGGFNYCGYSNYQSWVSQQTNGQKDIFIASPVATSQPPFDYFERSGSCSQIFKTPCIGNCQNNISSCGPLITGAGLFQVDTQYYGARFNYEWNTGNTDDTIHIASSGLYWLTTSREDACFEQHDSVSITIHPIPQTPWITDSYSININQPPSTSPIKICGRDSITLWGTHALNPDTVFWQGNPHSTLNDSTIKIFASGIYDFNVTGPGGCTNTNNIITIMDTFAIHDVLDPHIVFTDLVLQATDTISICQGETIDVKVIDSAFYSINGDLIPFKTVKWHISPGSIGASTYESHTNSIGINSTGLYTITDTLYNYCGDSVVYPISRSFYVIVNPNPTILLSIDGPSNSCPGDSVLLTATSNVSPFTWDNGTITTAFVDSMQVIAPSATPVLYQISAAYTDSTSGCSSSEQANFYLNPKPYPIVTIAPNDGIICPNDSVLLIAELGTNYYWISPEGDSIGTTQSIYVSVPGFYHCIHTATDGCVQTSNFVEAKEYNTPYLIATPGNFICENESVIISVQASNSAIIQWQPPLNGSDISKTVASPGVYTCEITDCGITTIDSVIITQSIPLSVISSTDSVMCPGDTLLLHGNSGMESYEWISETSTDPFLYITSPGTYTLKTGDIYGCHAVSAPYVVSSLPQAVAPATSDTSICSGQSISITATSPGPIAWYNSQLGGTPIHLGDTYTTPVISTNKTYYVRTLDSICGSAIVPVNVTMHNSSLYPSFSGDTVLCVGETLSFVSNITGVDYTWIGPVGLSDSMSSISIPSVSEIHEGYYTLQYSDSFCTSPTNSFYVEVNPVPVPYISSDSTIYICSGITTALATDTVYTTYSWSPDGQTTQSITIDSTGTYYVTVTQNGCTGISNTITVVMTQPLLPPVASDVNVCSGNTATLTASGSGIITWYDSLMNVLDTGIVFTTSAIDSNTFYFVKSIDSAGCSSTLKQVNVFIVEDSMPPLVFNTSPVCEGDSIYFLTDSLNGATFGWTGPGGFSSSQQYPFIAVSDLSDNGQYQLTVNINGCILPVATTTVLVNAIPILPSLVINPYYCEEDSLFLQVNLNPGDSIQWLSPGNSIISETGSIAIAPLALNNNGAYQLTLTNNGCINDTSFAITVNERPTAAITTNSPICAGDSLLIYTDANTGATYSWIGSLGFTSSGQNNLIPDANTAHSGIYKLVPSKNGCVGDTAQAIVSVVDFPVYDLGADTAFCTGTSITFSLPSAYSYLWNDGSAGNTLSVSDSGKYIVIATSGPGCSVTDSILIDNYNCILKDAANIITPNGDGINDYFYFKTEGLRKIEVNIFNRWGDLIYSWNELNGYWNGRNRINNDLVAPGTYFYVATITTFDYKTSDVKGFIQVYK